MANPKLLLVEDHEAEQSGLTKLAHRFDYDTDVVASGEEALLVMSRQKFAAILVDLTLPGMDGYECARRIREWEKAGKPRTPIIALTARSQISDLHACLAVGMDDRLGKPIDPEELRRILLRWVYDPGRPNLKVLIPYQDQAAPPCD
jgi:CheY-like chemotaxis protein